MPLAAANISVNSTWRFSRTSGPFSDLGQGPDGRSFNLNGLDLDEFGEALIEEIDLAVGVGVEIDLQDLQNLVLEDFGFSAVLSILILPTGDGSLCNVKPGTTSPFVGPFVNSSSPGVNVPPGGVFLISAPAAAEGGTEGPGDWLVGPGNKNLLVRNVGGSDMGVTIIIYGG